jgi:amino acid transporter
MFVRWIKKRNKGWRHKAAINGTGAIVTLITVINIGATKFIHGAWIIVMLIPIFVIGMKLIKKHYDNVAEELSLCKTEIEKENEVVDVKDFIIVPVD